MNCLKCETITIHRHCDDDQHSEHLCKDGCNDSDCDNYADYGNERQPCISLHEYGDRDWYICPGCECYHVICDKCNVLCRMIAHSGAFIINKNDDEFRYRIPESALKRDNLENIFTTDPKKFQILTPEQMLRYDEDFSDDGYCYYYTGDYNLYYLDSKQIYPTGPDGGMGTDWKCPNVNTNLVVPINNRFVQLRKPPNFLILYPT